VGDTKVGFIQSPSKFDKERGLDYIFVEIHPEYWSEAISRKISYSQCANTTGGILDVDKLISIIPISTQPPLPNFAVYAYGGASGLVQGVIMEFGAEIQTSIPGSGGKEHVSFKNVTKVLMNKNYLPGDLGAPVYIPLQIPNSNQTLANPVGQVVESVGDSSEENI